MSGLAAIEGELNGIIQEYLENMGFDSTLEKFNEECSSKGKVIANKDRNNKPNQKVNVVLNEMVQLFCHGQRKEFFRRWLQNIPANTVNNDTSAQKLEFELNIHFAIYPLKNGIKNQAEESMNAFKTFIETRGRSLSQTTEFLPYFALPYVPNPQDNQGYQEIFSERWFLDLQRKLENFLTTTLKSQRQPKLVDIYQNQKNSNNIPGNFHQQLTDAEKRTMAYMKKFNKVQADYHSLIGITAELVDSLENSIRGVPVTSEYLQNICNRLFSSQLSQQSIDFSRPGTAGEFIRQSLAYQKNAQEKVEDNSKGNLTLDFSRLKYDLAHANDRRKAFILQALRWRLTKAPAGDQRDKALESFIANDILNCKNDSSKNNIIGLLKSDNEAVKQYMARFLNTLASLNKGRGYLTNNIELVKTMHVALRSEKGDSLCRQNILAALQKLSLRRNLQLLMINDEIIAWLVGLLADTEVLCDYTLEYAVALLMNLCLRSAGKRKCANDQKKTLKVLSDLVGNSNQEIRPYVNGALYSILSIPSIREHAKKMNLEEILSSYLSEGNQEMKTQIQFIINQINSNQQQNEAESDDEEEEDDEEDQDVMEADLDRTEILKPAQNELFGENLLHNEYSADVAKLHKRRSGSDFLSDSVVLSRPTTPHHLRQSAHFQNRPPHANGNNIATNSSTNISETNINNKISQQKEAGDKQKQVAAKESDNKKQAQNSPNKTITTTNPVKHSTDFVNLNNSTMASLNSKQVDSPKIKQKTTTTTAQSANKTANSTAANTKSLLGRSNSMERRLPPSSPSSRHVNGSTNPVQHSTISSRQYDSQAFERPDSARDKNNGDTENASFYLYSKTNQQQQPKTSDQSIVFPRNSSASNINYASINSNGNSVSNSFTPKYSTFEPRASSASSSKSRNSSSNSGAANMSDMNSTRKLNGKPTIN